MKRVLSVGVLLTLVSLSVFAGGYFMNDTGETAYGLSVEFSEPVTITGFGDVLSVIKKYGAMPYAAYEGTLKEEDINNYDELFNELRKFLRQLYGRAQKNELDITWKNGAVTNPWLIDLKKLSIGFFALSAGMFPFSVTFNRLSLPCFSISTR